MPRNFSKFSKLQKELWNSHHQTAVKYLRVTDIKFKNLSALYNNSKNVIEKTDKK